MAKKYDAEDLLDTVLGIMTASLNTRIAAIEAEKIADGKGVTPTLAAVASGSYYLQAWSDKILNTSPAIFYGLEDVQTESNGSAVAKTYKIFVEVMLVDAGINGANDGSRRLNRYARALEEIFAESFAPAIGHGKVKVDSIRPMAFKLALDSDDEVKVGGISLLVTLV